MERRKGGILVFLLLGIILLTQCHSTKWNDINASKDLQPAPEAIQKIFQAFEDNVMLLPAKSPGHNYKYDIGEKDLVYSGDSLCMRFDRVTISLHEKMPEEKVIADLSFLDGIGNKVHIEEVDLLRFIPMLDMIDDMAYPELLLEEFNRFGYSFRKEHNEFEMDLVESMDLHATESTERVYRASVTNNCLSPTKWEFALTSEDYSDFDQRCGSEKNLNQNRIFAHSWFKVDPDLYLALLKIKNPQLDIDYYMEYEQLSNKSEEVKIDFEKLRQPIQRRAQIELLEVGHKSGKKVEPLDREEYYKTEFGLMLDRPQELTYESILDQPIATTQFTDDGFYSEEVLKKFDPSWMKQMDEVKLDILDVDGTEAYAQITLEGEWSPYKIILGNVDLALLNEQSLRGFLFGMNTYPKGRRYNPAQSTIAFDADLLPNDKRPYLLMVDSKTGNWVNNQYKGVEKVYLTYSTLERDILEIYVLSYERITPLWMASIKLPKDVRETVRVRKQLYDY